MWTTRAVERRPGEDLVNVGLLRHPAQSALATGYPLSTKPLTECPRATNEAHFKARQAHAAQP